MNFLYISQAIWELSVFCYAISQIKGLVLNFIIFSSMKWVYLTQGYMKLWLAHSGKVSLLMFIVKYSLPHLIRCISCYHLVISFTFRSSWLSEYVQINHCKSTYPAPILPRILNKKLVVLNNNILFLMPLSVGQLDISCSTLGCSKQSVHLGETWSRFYQKARENWPMLHEISPLEITDLRGNYFTWRWNCCKM